MKLVLIVILALSCVYAFDNSDEFINEINEKQNFWKAGRNFHKDTPSSYLSGLLGAKLLPENLRKNVPVVTHEIDASTEIPETFDARTQWPKCKTINQIADQSACGSCWAVSVASAISDRICIHSDGKLQPEVSARELMSCYSGMVTNGCKGGTTLGALSYWKNYGIVTGGRYGSNIGCQPYPFAPCDHHGDGTKPKCPKKGYPTPSCVETCDNSTINFKQDLIYGEVAYDVQNKEQVIQLEILKNGPVVTSYIVFEDFLLYKSGVYVKTSNTSKGVHAVRVLGWGIENDTKYWLVANSWNEEWGDKGYFKIRRGTDECWFESFVTAGMPKYENF